MLEKLKPCPFCGGDVKIINAEKLTINHHRSGGEQVVANCKDCIHVEVCRYYTNELAKANGIPLKVEETEGLLECDDCEHFKDRSRFVELPCEFISKKDLIRELSAQCAVNKIDLETAHDMIKHLPYFRTEAEQALKEREK